MATAVRTEQLSKHYGHTVALDRLDLEIETGEVFGYLGPNGAGKSTTIALAPRGDPRRRRAGRGSSISTPGATRAAIHRRLAYVPSEANLWPSLTGAETLRFLGTIHGSVDHAYRDELVERFELTPDKKIRAYSHGNRQKVAADRRAREPGRPAAARRADDRARSRSWSRCSANASSKRATAGRQCCCRRTS